MNHDDVQRYLDGRLAGDALSAFEQHLSGCAQCQAEVRAWRDLAGKFAEATKPLLQPPSPAETARLMAKVDNSPVRRWVPALALAVCLALAAVWWGSRAAPTDVLPVELVGQGPLGSDELEAVGAKLAVSQATLELTGKLRFVRHTKRDVRVRLERGRVGLAVSHRASEQTFVVEAGAYEVHVVGTQFSVEREGDQVRVEVLEGRVRVDGAGRSADVVPGSPWSSAPVEAPEPAGELDAGVDEPKRPAAEPADLEKWRQAALSGQCPAVIPKVRRWLLGSPRHAGALRVLADCLRKTGADTEAIEAYQKVIAASRGDEGDRARLIVADLYQQRSQHAAAERLLREYLSHSPPPELEAAARLRLARSLIARGEKGKARAELQRVTKKLPGTPSATEALELLKGLD